MIIALGCNMIIALGCNVIIALGCSHRRAATAAPVAPPVCASEHMRTCEWTRASVCVCARACAYGCKQCSTAACGRRPGSNISPRAGRSAAAPARDKRQQTACRSSAYADGLRRRPTPTTCAGGVAECRTGAGRPSRLQPGGVAAQQRLEGVCADVRVGAHDHALATRTCRCVCGRDSPHICGRDSPHICGRDSPHICAGTRPTSAPGLAPHLRRDSTALTDPWVTAGYSRDSGVLGVLTGYSWDSGVLLGSTAR
jgi:hypothetical protein